MSGKRGQWHLTSPLCSCRPTGAQRQPAGGRPPGGGRAASLLPQGAGLHLRATHSAIESTGTPFELGSHRAGGMVMLTIF